MQEQRTFTLFVNNEKNNCRYQRLWWEQDLMVQMYWHYCFPTFKSGKTIDGIGKNTDRA
jgi:hypothetical protein